LTLEATTIRIKESIGSSGGALNLTLNATGTAMLDTGGRYGNGTLNSSSGALTLGAGAAFDQVTLGSNLRVSGGTLAIYNGLTLADGTIFNVGNLPISTYGTETIGTPGTAWVQRPGGMTTIASTGTLALGPGLTWVGYGTFNGGTLLNHGTIRNIATTTNISPVTFVNDGLVDTYAGLTQIVSTDFVNDGLVQSTRGRTNIASTTFANNGELRVNAGRLDIAPGSWTNNGTLRMSKGDITLSVYTPLSALSGRIIRAAGNFFVTDILDLQGGTLDIGSGGIFGGFGLTQLKGGTLLNGTLITTSTGTDTTGIYAPGGWLDGIIIGNSMYTGSVSIRNGLTLADGVTLTAQSNLVFSGSQTLTALGTATLLSAPYGSRVGVVTVGDSLTVGSGMVWKGVGSLSFSGGSIVNNGTIDSNVSGQLFDFNSPLTVLNNSLIRLSGGAADFSKVTIAPGSTIQNAGGQLTVTGTAWQPGTLSMTGGTTYMGGNFTLSSLSNGISRTGGDVHFMGLLDLQGGTLDIGSGGVFGTGGLTRLNGGTVSNGTLVSGDGTSFWSSAGHLTNMTIGGDLTMARGDAQVIGGLQLADGADLDMTGFRFSMLGSQSITTSGTATMRSGALVYNQSGTGAKLTLGSGVTLSANASVRDYYYRSAAPFRGTFINKGTLSPGGSGAAGTMRLYGDMDTSNGTLRLEQASTSSYDKISVSGTITLGPGTVITRTDLPGASYLAGDIFNVLESIPVAGVTAYSGIINGPAPLVAGFDSAITPAPAPVYLQLTAETPAPAP
jgi:hypothetical protein